MIRLSLNYISSTIALLRWFDTYGLSSVNEIAYSRIISISVEDTVHLAAKCGWISQGGGQSYVLTTRGKEILAHDSNGNSVEAKRAMLRDYVISVSPIWANKVPYGRYEASLYMTNDEKACFTEAQLLKKNPNITVVNWWDSLSNHIRHEVDDTKLETGRTGEQYTLQYELTRTGVSPKWLSIDSNMLGYDIKSQVSQSDSSVLLIEVKSSSVAIESAYFHISSNEWSVADASPSYIFHLWHLKQSKKRLAVISKEDIRPYIPTNNLLGQWESTKIPFSCFEDQFVDIQ